MVQQLADNIVVRKDGKTLRNRPHQTSLVGRLTKEILIIKFL